MLIDALPRMHKLHMRMVITRMYVSWKVRLPPWIRDLASVTSKVLPTDPHAIFPQSHESVAFARAVRASGSCNMIRIVPFITFLILPINGFAAHLLGASTCTKHLSPPFLCLLAILFARRDSPKRGHAPAAWRRRWRGGLSVLWVGAGNERLIDQSTRCIGGAQGW